MAEQFQSQTIVPGVGGLNITALPDLIASSQLVTGLNAWRNRVGAITSRPGLNTWIFSDLGNFILIHHARSLADTFTVLGKDSAGNIGCFDTQDKTDPQERAFWSIDSGYSSSPGSAITYSNDRIGEPWVYIADAAKMGKVRVRDCAVGPFGLQAPEASDQNFNIDEWNPVPPSAFGAVDLVRFLSPFLGFTVTAGGPGVEGELLTYGTERKTTIDVMDTAGWTNNQGTGGGAPSNATDTTNKKEGTASVKFTTDNPASGAFYQFWNKANVLNLSEVDGKTATDSDSIHLWIRVDRPDKLEELRLYFVLNTTFETDTVPGTDESKNTDAYMKSFRPSDFTSIFELTDDAITGAGTANTNLSTLNLLPPIEDPRPSIDIIRSQLERSRSASVELQPGRGQWTEVGILGLPLKRGDFRRIGNDASRSWGNITGLVVVVQVKDATDINFWIDDIYLTGGAGLDSTSIGAIPYDYRITNIDPRTRDESNGSPIQSVGFRLDSNRRAINITPPATGNSDLRQAAYRRGGTISNNWYFVGENTSDGGTIVDEKSDLEIVAGSTIPINHDAPVTSFDEGGATILAQPIPSIWGPVSGIFFGCGDPNRKGTLYWSLPDQPAYWPASNTYPVCTSDEELMQGCAYGGQAYVFSRERLYAVYPDLADTARVQVTPTQCHRGLASRTGLAVCSGGIYFVARDGIYRTVGGAEESITKDTLWPMFETDTLSRDIPADHSKVDFTQPDRIHLEPVGQFLYFTAAFEDGVSRIYCYSTEYNEWFGPWQLATTVYSLHGVNERVWKTPFVGGEKGIFLLDEEYYSDDSSDGITLSSSAISTSFLTASLNQKLPDNKKLYGDFSTEVDRSSHTVTITPVTEFSTDQAALTISTLSGRQTYHGTLDDIKAKNIAFRVSWTTDQVNPPPQLFYLKPSFTPQPEDTVNRATNWDYQDLLADKYVKGVILDVDTYGSTKTVDIQADGVTQKTISVTSTGRQALQFTWEQFRGRLVRLKPTDSNEWSLYEYRWIFDQEPLKLDRWETQRLTHNTSQQKVPLYGMIYLESTAQVTLQIDSVDHDGDVVSKTYPIASTGGVKRQVYVTFEAQKGYLLRYLLTSSQPFLLYREETFVLLSVWGGQPIEVHPFGTDDLDGVINNQTSGRPSKWQPGGTGP